MRIDLHFTPHQIEDMSLRDRIVVVIDVLRSSTTIAAALYNGAKEIIPVATVESAVKISGNLFGDVILLGGERNGKMIEGFNLGNSPADYSEEKVRGKSIIFSTTNGSQAMVKARYAREMVVCGFINISVVVDFLLEQKRDVALLCAGENGVFSIEDSVCAGLLVQRLAQQKSIDMSDAALAASTLYKSLGKAIGKVVRNSEHGRYLSSIGYEDDLDVCAGIDTIPVLPQMVGNVVRLKRDVEKKEAPKVSVSPQ